MTHADTPRITAETGRIVPPVMVRSMSALVLLCLALVSLAVITGRTPDSRPPVSPLRHEMVVTLTSDMSGAATVRDAQGTVVARLTPDEGGFIAGVHRVVLFERRKAGLPETGPVVIQAYQNGRIALIDPATGWRGDLMGFGADNADAFARLLAFDIGGSDRTPGPAAVAAVPQN